MLNKNQSHKRNSWKYAVVIPALIGFVFLFQVKVIAQEKSSLNKNEIIQTHEGADVTFDSKETDKSLKTIKNVFKEEKIVTNISKIKRNSDGDIIGIYIQMKSEDGRKKELLINQNSPIDRIMVYTIRLENGLYDFGIKHLNKKEVAAIRAEIHRKRESAYNSKNDESSYVFDKISSDKELESNAKDLKKEFNIDFKVLNIKRNEAGEIIIIKLAFDDNKGNKGTTEQNRTIPIRPIFFKIEKLKDGKTKMGFYDNPDMVQKEFDAFNEAKITTIESIPNDALIYVDTERFVKEELNELDPKGLEKIEILKDAESLKKYGAKDKGVVYVITTNWTLREQNIAYRQQASPTIFTIENGNEVVIIDKYTMKIPRYPSVVFTDSSPVLVFNDADQKNPRYTLEKIDLRKIKTIQLLDVNGKELKQGAPIYKMVISTK